MASTPLNSYVCRWNPDSDPPRKEWRRRDRLTVVVGGGSVTPGALEVSLVADPATATVSDEVELTATATGGTAPYTYIFAQIAGAAVTLTGGPGNTRSFIAVAGASPSFRVTVTDSAGSPQVEQAEVTVVTGEASGALFPGHIPNRVLVGMATPAEGSNVDPGWDEARSIIGQPIYEARRFTSSWISTSQFNSMIAQGAAANSYPVISFKTPGGANGAGWDQVTNGVYDNDLITLFNLAVGQRTAGPGGTPRPFACSFNHEPAGSGITNTDLSKWAAMQQRMVYYFAGRRGGTAGSAYNPAHDVSDVMAWAPIGNGFWWRTGSAALLANAAAAFPQSLINALRDHGGVGKGGIGLNDFYDTDYVDQQGALTNESLRIPGTGVRTWKRIENFMAWWRARNGGACGCGEFGVIDGAEMDRSFAIMFANRDLWAISNYFNSQNNSDHEWRIVPSDYPDGNPTGSKGLVDFGGNAQSQGRLDRFKVGLDNSISAQFTGPL